MELSRAHIDYCLFFEPCKKNLYECPKTDASFAGMQKKMRFRLIIQVGHVCYVNLDVGKRLKH